MSVLVAVGYNAVLEFVLEKKYADLVLYVIDFAFWIDSEPLKN